MCLRDGSRTGSETASVSRQRPRSRASARLAQAATVMPRSSSREILLAAILTFINDLATIADAIANTVVFICLAKSGVLACDLALSTHEKQASRASATWAIAAVW